MCASRLVRRVVAPWFLATLLLPGSLAAQALGSVSGTVTRAEDGSPIAGVTVSVKGLSLVTVTSPKGQYLLQRVPAGSQTLVFRWVGYAATEYPATVAGDGTVTVDASLSPLPVSLADLVVVGASRTPERQVQAPSEISSIDPRVLQSTSVSGQAPMVLRDVPGVDLTQSGVNDFNVNARGFNSSLNRRVLVLQDGRDLSIAFLGAQEWTGLSIPTEDFKKVEFVSGPGSALYGANSYNGVLDLGTPAAREVVGTKFTVGGGMLSSRKADLRQAGVFGEGRYGYRFNLGYTRSDTWSRSRTSGDGLDMRREYAGVSDTAAQVSRELRPLLGQTRNATTGAAEGDREPIVSLYGTGRVDYYAGNGSVVTAEGGVTRTENEVFVTGIGRVQVTGALRPWARLALDNPGYNLMAYWNGRRTVDPQYSLASGAPLEETSDIFHAEGQKNFSFADDRGRFVVGASARSINLDTETTLILPQNDNRSDSYYAGFAQFSWEFSPAFRLVAAARYDDGNLIDGQFSPKASLVVSPDPNHSFRFTVNRAFQTPNYSEFFLRAAAGAPANFSLLEAGMRQAFGAALAGVPSGQLFDNSAAVPVWARGNATLQVEKTTGLEFGYRGDLSRRAYVTLEGFYNFLSDFVTDLLPGVNPAFQAWTAPAAVPASLRPTLEGAVRGALLGSPATRLAGLGLTRTEDGRTAIVVSYANAGKAEMWGANLGAGWQMTDRFRVDGYLSWFDYEVDKDLVAVGDQLLSNTPEWRSRMAVSYNSPQGFDARVGVRTSSGFPWAAGVFMGWVEPVALFDADAGYRLNNHFRIFASGTNLFDTPWYSLVGGSVNGARVLGGVSATF